MISLAPEPQVVLAHGQSVHTCLGPSKLRDTTDKHPKRLGFGDSACRGDAGWLATRWTGGADRVRALRGKSALKARCASIRSPDAVVDEQKPGSLVVNGKHWERSRICEVPLALALLPHGSLADPLQPLRFSPKLKLQNCFAVMAARWEPRRSIHHSIERNVSD